MPLSTFLGNELLDHVLRGEAYTPPPTVYVSLHSSNPGVTGAGEITGGSYARKACTFDVAVAKATQNSASVSFPNMPAVTVSHGGIWDAATGGNYLMGGATPAPVTVAAGNTFTIPIADLDISI